MQQNYSHNTYRKTHSPYSISQSKLTFNALNLAPLRKDAGGNIIISNTVYNEGMP
jgi:hypothetical protein